MKEEIDFLPKRSLFSCLKQNFLRGIDCQVSSTCTSSIIAFCDLLKLDSLLKQMSCMGGGEGVTAVQTIASMAVFAEFRSKFKCSLSTHVPLLQPVTIDTLAHISIY